MRLILSKVMWVGRATVFTVGLAVTLALMLGVATAALAAVPGDPFRLGRINTIDSLSTLVGSVNNAMLRIDNNSAGSDATALNLQVEPGKAPVKVNATAGKATNLNADELDGKQAEDFYYYNEKVNDSFYADEAGHAAADSAPVSGYEHVRRDSAFNSYAHKVIRAECPAGERVIGDGGSVIVTLADPDSDRAPITIRASYPTFDSELVGSPPDAWVIIADETSEYAGDWRIDGYAICAHAAN